MECVQWDRNSCRFSLEDVLVDIQPYVPACTLFHLGSFSSSEWIVSQEDLTLSFITGLCLNVVTLVEMEFERSLVKFADKS